MSGKIAGKRPEKALDSTPELAWKATADCCFQTFALCPLPHALCPLPHALCPLRERSELMPVAHFRFYEELNDFLPPAKRKREFGYSFRGTTSVKHAIEAIGVPHPEVDLILADGHSVDFTYRLVHQNRISVYPVFESFDISPLVQLRPEPLRRSTFVLDVHLGKLARMMRLLGFDCLYRNDYDDPEIVDISVRENRIILTRDRHLLQASVITRGYWVRSGFVDNQVEEVLRRFDLSSQIRSFRRCLLCNGDLESVRKEDILQHLEPKTILYYNTFFRCRRCGQIYWKGTHFEKLEKKVEKWTSEASL
jgi:uncharacterized protein with PIN domain